MKTKKNLTLISLMLGVMMLVSASGLVSATCPTGGCDTPNCDERYRVDTYESDYSTTKDVFAQGETVYAKGWDGPFLYRLKFYYPNGTLAKECPQTSIVGENTTCNLNLAANAPVGTWKVQLEYKSGGSWTFWDCEPFTVEAMTTPTCTLTITNPTQNQWFDSEPVEIKWALTEGCKPVDEFKIWYEKDGNCDSVTGSWFWVENGLAPGDVQNPSFPNYHYVWDKPSTSGQYCVKVKVTSNGALDVSEKFNVDLAPPEVDLSVGDNHFGECEDEQEGDCYVNQQTPITLTCEDNVPVADWQSGVAYIEYRYSVDGGEFTNWMTYEGSFNFPEDTNHVLEYRCYDNVGKVDTESKDFVVESNTPELDRTVTGPQEYPEEGCDNCTKYFNTNTEICMHLTNFPEHTIPEVTITCDYWWGDNEESLTFQHGTFTLEDDECFKYTEDSYHNLECKVTDALGNSYTHPVWLDVVDAKAPVINVNIGTPKYENEGLYVSDDTKICVSAVDNTPHPVGFVELNCEYDWKALSGDEWTDMGALTLDEEGCFYFAENSYHNLRCTAIDALDNEAQLNQEFIVDTLAPVLTKEVGKPSHDCSGLWEDVTGKCEEDWDWIVTQSTPIYLSCNDVQPHPSEVSELCYKISWDGTVTQDWTCVDPKQYKDEKVLITFNEDCEHTLEFYCVDNVGNPSETDVELFKVEGNPFEISLDKKWNLISFPFNLLSNNIEEVFEDASENIEGVWSYENGEWKVYIPGVTSGLTEVVPGRGYWVKTTEATTLLVGGELMGEGQMLPPSVELDKGWNLIGYYGTSSPKQAYCSLFSLVDTQEGFPRWSALWGYDSSSDYFVPLNSWSNMEAGKGYWIEMDVEDQYSPSTTCWGLVA